MSQFLRPSAPALRDPTPRELSACLFHWEGAGASLDSVGGQAGVFTRPGDVVDVVDGNGDGYTARHSLPAWDMRDWDGDADGVREAMGLLMGPTDFLHWLTPPVDVAHRGRLELVETGARTTANATLAAIANDAVSGARFWVDTSGTYYRANYHNGTTLATSTLTVGQPTAGQRVVLTWYLLSGGQLRVSQSINGAAPTHGNETGSLALVAWASGARVRLNSRGDTENPARGWYRSFKLAEVTLSESTIAVLR